MSILTALAIVSTAPMVAAVVLWIVCWLTGKLPRRAIRGKNGTIRIGDGPPIEVSKWEFRPGKPGSDV